MLILHLPSLHHFGNRVARDTDAVNGVPPNCGSPQMPHRDSMASSSRVFSIILWSDSVSFNLHPFVNTRIKRKEEPEGTGWCRFLYWSNYGILGFTAHV